jgi:uncharacterized protein (DUF1697 family)
MRRILLPGELAGGSTLFHVKSYVALLRGIGPGNPNMRNDRLREVFESLGYHSVRTVISSGNVLFDSSSSAVRILEAQIEEAIAQGLGFTTTAIIRSKRQIQALVDRDPFMGVQHSDKSNLNVTFMKKRPQTTLSFPYRPPDRDYIILGLHGREICSVIDLTSAKTPDLMAWMEKEFGKAITTRTYNTVRRVLRRFNEPGR